MSKGFTEVFLKKMSISSVELSVILASFLFTLIYIKFLKRDSRIYKKFQEIPGPPTLPIVGNALSFAVPHTGNYYRFHKYIRISISKVNNIFYDFQNFCKQ